MLDRNSTKSARFCADSREPCAVEVAEVKRSAFLRVQGLDCSQHVGTPNESAVAHTNSGGLAPWSIPMMLICTI